MKKIILTLALSSLLLSACGPKTTVNTTPSPTPKVVELSLKDRPYISLIPRTDGHELKLKIDNIPSSITSIEYELLYSASDNGLEIEKGVGDTLKTITKNMERDLLLGTASCTNGCKYKYDAGITGGTLSLNFITNGSQTATYQTTFVLKTSADIKKDGGLSLTDEKFSIKASPVGNNYYILMKNFGVPTGSSAITAYTVFANDNANGKLISVSPTTFTKADKSLVGDYLSQ